MEMERKMFGGSQRKVPAADWKGTSHVFSLEKWHYRIGGRTLAVLDGPISIVYYE